MILLNNKDIIDNKDIITIDCVTNDNLLVCLYNLKRLLLNYSKDTNKEAIIQLIKELPLINNYLKLLIFNDEEDYQLFLNIVVTMKKYIESLLYNVVDLSVVESLFNLGNN